MSWDLKLKDLYNTKLNISERLDNLENNYKRKVSNQQQPSVDNPYVGITKIKLKDSEKRVKRDLELPQVRVSITKQ